MVALLGAFVSLSSLQAATAEEKQTETDQASAGEPWGEQQIVLVITKTAGGLEQSTSNFILSDARLVLLGDRWFVRGQPVSFKSKISSRFVSHTAVAWENVVEFSAFDRDQFASFAKEQQNRQEED